MFFTAFQIILEIPEFLPKVVTYLESYDLWHMNVLGLLVVVCKHVYLYSIQTNYNTPPDEYMDALHRTKNV